MLAHTTKTLLFSVCLTLASSITASAQDRPGCWDGGSESDFQLVSLSSKPKSKLPAGVNFGDTFALTEANFYLVEAPPARSIFQKIKDRLSQSPAPIVDLTTPERIKLNNPALFIEADSNEIILDLNKTEISTPDWDRIRVVAELPKNVIAPDSSILVPKNLSERLLSGLEISRVGDNDVEGYEESSVLMTRSNPNLPGGQTADAFLEDNADALVQIISYQTNGFKECVGAHIGGGHILTARHCAGESYDFLFGSIQIVDSSELPKWRNDIAAGGRPTGEIECRSSDNDSNSNQTLSLGSSQITSDGKSLDVMILKAHGEFIQNSVMSPTRSIAETFFTYGYVGADDDASSIVGPSKTKLATIWATRRGGPVKIAIDSDGNNIGPSRFEKVVFRPSPTPHDVKPFNCNILNRDQGLALCANKELSNNASRDGWTFTCPTIDGVSGSPVFAWDGQEESAHIIAVVSSADAGQFNCIAPVIFEPSPLPPN